MGRDQDDDQALRGGHRGVLDGGDLGVGDRKPCPSWCAVDVQPPGRLGEDQAPALGEAEQPPCRGERAGAGMPAELAQRGGDVVLGDLAQLTAGR